MTGIEISFCRLVDSMKRLLSLCLLMLLLPNLISCSKEKESASYTSAEFFAQVNTVFGTDLKYSDFTGSGSIFSYTHYPNDYTREDIYLGVQNGRIESVTVTYSFIGDATDAFPQVVKRAVSASAIQAFLELSDYDLSTVDLACMQAISQVYCNWPVVFAETVSPEQVNALITDGVYTFGDWECTITKTMGTITFAAT